MPSPTLDSVTPSRGRAGGGDLVRLLGSGFAPRVRVLFGDAPAEVVSVHEAGALSVADVRTPAHAEALVRVVIENVDAAGEPVAGERAALEDAFRFVRPPLADESDLTRLVRTLLRTLKRDLLVNSTMRVSVDYADARHVDGMQIVPLATLPALVLTPLQMPENRRYSTNELREEVAVGPSGPEIVRHAPPLTVDLELRLTGSSDSTVELLNLIAAVGGFLNRTKWVEMARHPAEASRGTAGYELRAGPIQMRLDGPDGLGAFSVDLVVRGFDLDDGGALDRGAAVEESAIDTRAVGEQAESNPISRRS